jgi:hypothetical protein
MLIPGTKYIMDKALQKAIGTDETTCDLISITNFTGTIQIKDQAFPVNVEYLTNHIIDFVSTTTAKPSTGIGRKK